MPLEILYEDKSLAVCVKPVGALSEEPGLPALLREKLGGEAWCVHRLDRAVGGVMVYARTKQAAGRLSQAIAEGKLVKEYLAVCQGHPEPPSGEMRDLLFKDSGKNKAYVVKRMRKGVKEASLEYETLATVQTENGPLSLVRVLLHTGRFHQIRVQFASRKMPLVGDGKYGSRDSNGEIALWSHRLVFPHPVTGKAVEMKAEPSGYPWELFQNVPVTNP